MGKYFPPTPGSKYADFVQVCGGLFAITFYIYRVFLWFKVSFRLFSDCFTILKNGMAEKLRPGKIQVVYMFLVAGLLLGLLQIYWAYLIGLAVMDALS